MNADEFEARTKMLIGQLQVGQVFTNFSVALVHGMARPLGAQLHIPQGIENALILPSIMEFSAMAEPNKYAETVRMMGIVDEATSKREAADMTSDAVHE